MIIIHTALHLEAKALIEKLKLKRKLDFLGFEYFENQESGLLVSGIGKVNAAAAVGTLFGYLSANNVLLEKVALLNFGLAGATKDFETGKLYRVKKITDYSAEISYYPDLLLKSEIPVASIATFDRAVSEDNYPDLKNTLVDMEASGVFAAAAKFIAPHQIHSLKIVADHLQPDFFKTKDIDSLISNQFESFIKYYADLHALFEYVAEEETEISDAVIDLALEKIIRDLKLSVSQQRQLSELARQYEVVTKNNISEFLTGFHYKLSEHKKINAMSFQRLAGKLDVEIRKFVS